MRAILTVMTRARGTGADQSVVFRVWLAGLLLNCLLLAACTHHDLRAPAHHQEQSELADCRMFYQQLDRTIREAGVIDARAQRLENRPYFRASRFYASYDPTELPHDVYRLWLLHLNQLALQGLTMEWHRLPAPAKAKFHRLWPVRAAHIESTLSGCGERLTAFIAHSPRLQKIDLPDHYQTWKRWLGLYPLAALPFYRRIIEDHEKFQREQHRHLQILNGASSLSDWTLFKPTGDRPNIPETLATLGRTPRDLLGIPQLDNETREALLKAFSPSLAIANGRKGLAHNDHPGTFQVPFEREIALNSNRASVYTHIGYGRYRNQITLQLQYSVWFSERKPEATLDLLAGQYNGLTWRVHLHPAGAVIGYDKMHQCGCWYQFYPAMGFKPQPELPVTQEPFYLGATLDPRHPLTLWLASNTHHLLGVSHRQPSVTAEVYATRPYNELRALPDHRGDYHSPFDAQGIIPASRRLERYVFWPMGIANPGAQRIHGTHAIAFIGRRHFDDPRLLEELGL